MQCFHTTTLSCNHLCNGCENLVWPRVTHKLCSIWCLLLPRLFFSYMECRICRCALDKGTSNSSSLNEWSTQSVETLKNCSTFFFLPTRRTFPRTSPHDRPCLKTKRPTFVSWDFGQPCTTVPADIQDSNKNLCSSNNPLPWLTFTLSRSRVNLIQKMCGVSPEQLVSAILAHLGFELFFLSSNPFFCQRPSQKLVAPRASMQKNSPRPRCSATCSFNHAAPATLARSTSARRSGCARCKYATRSKSTPTSFAIAMISTDAIHAAS